MKIYYNKTRFNLPIEHKRLIFITHSSRFCIGWFINKLFIEHGTSFNYDPNKVLFWVYEDNLMPDDFQEEQKYLIDKWL